VIAPTAGAVNRFNGFSAHPTIEFSAANNSERKAKTVETVPLLNPTLDHRAKAR
jgi:hypothetical protein